ncbi:MAG: hypothetical protein J1E61_08465 [Lachnospiraceae bacterium]|nr:hypothetical protein [Lachnospiraceae bacterium]
MKKMRKLFLAAVLISSMLILQGCSFSDLTTPVTSHSVTKDDNNGLKFHVDLKADMSQNYKWYVYSDSEIDQAKDKVSDGMFNDTRTNNYEFIVREEKDFTFYLVLVKDANLETARIYPYKMSVKGGDIQIEELAAYNLNTDKKLMKTLTSALDLSAE